MSWKMSEDGGTNQFIVVCDSKLTNNDAIDNVSDISAKILQHSHPVTNRNTVYYATEV